MKMAQSMAMEEGKALTVKGIKLVSDSLQGFAFKDGSSAWSWLHDLRRYGGGEEIDAGIDEGGGGGGGGGGSLLE